MPDFDFFQVPIIRPRSLLLSVPIVAYATVLSLRPAPLQSLDITGPPPDSVADTGGVAGVPRDVGASVRADSGGIDTPKTISWRTLEGLNYRNGTRSRELTALNGMRVRIPGFIVPLEDFQDSAKEFLLVPYFGACVHTPPPPPNQMVFVKMSGGPTTLALFAPVWIEGRLIIASYQSPYGAVGFRMTAERITPYKVDP